MTTKHDTKESSVVLAFAELAQLERERAEFAHAKRDASERLDLQAREINELRARLLAERPRAWARRRHEQARLRAVRERATAATLAVARVAHRERLSLYQAELEAKRQHLAEIEIGTTIERPGRRVLEWSVPAAATVLVAFLGITLLGEEQAVAHAADPIDPAQLIDSEDATPEVRAELPEPKIDVEPEPEPAVEPKPEPKPKSTKPKPTKPEPTKPEPTKRKNPLKLGDFGGNPLG